MCSHYHLSTHSDLCGIGTASPVPDWHLLLPGLHLSCSQLGEALLFSSITGVKGLVTGLVQTTYCLLAITVLIDGKLWTCLQEGEVGLLPVACVGLARHGSLVSTLCQALDLSSGHVKDVVTDP